MPVAVAVLVPSAPALLPGLTGDRVPEVAAVRRAVAAALGALAGLDRVDVVAPHVPGTLAGFGAPAAPRSPSPLGSWPHALAAALLDATAGSPTDRTWSTWPTGSTGSTGWTGPARSAAGPGAADPGDPARTGLLLLADGSRTRGPRAPGGEDPRGDVVDAELLAALRDGRAPVVPDAAVVGATAPAAVELLVGLTAGGRGSVDVLHAAAPLGVFYLVALARPGDGP